MDIDEVEVFHYRPECHVAGCPAPASFKVAAVWSDGTSRELKNYGLACADHVQALETRALASREGLRLAEGESVGPVRSYLLEPGRRDTDLTPLEATTVRPDTAQSI